MVLTRSQAEQAESRRGLFISRLESVTPSRRQGPPCCRQSACTCHKNQLQRVQPARFAVGVRRRPAGWRRGAQPGFPNAPSLLSRSRRSAASQVGDDPQAAPAASAATATATAAAAAAAAAVPHRRSRRALLVALLLTLALQLLMRGLLGAPPEPVDVPGPAARSRLLWLPLCQRLATPLYSLCYPGEAAQQAVAALSRLQAALPRGWPHGWRGGGGRAATPTRGTAEGPPPPSWLLQQQAASAKMAALQQELASCSSDAHRARRQHVAAADEAQRCQRQLKAATADAVKCQGKLLAALDGQAEEAAAGEAAMEQAQAAQAAGREVQQQLAMVESRAALLAAQLQEAGRARQRAEEAAGGVGWGMQWGCMRLRSWVGEWKCCIHTQAQCLSGAARGWVAGLPDGGGCISGASARSQQPKRGVDWNLPRCLPLAEASASKCSRSLEAQQVGAGGPLGWLWAKDGC